MILYIDSPGGSAVVSELLHREIVQLDAKKPVVDLDGQRGRQRRLLPGQRDARDRGPARHADRLHRRHLLRPVAERLMAQLRCGASKSA